MDFLGTLNGGTSAGGVTTTGCFADKCDWRLAIIEELQGILIEPYPCGTSPCTTIPGETTVSSSYWSSSASTDFPLNAWSVDFSNGYVFNSVRTFGRHVRAVRGGS